MPVTDPNFQDALPFYHALGIPQAAIPAIANASLLDGTGDLTDDKFGPTFTANPIDIQLASVYELQPDAATNQKWFAAGGPLADGSPGVIAQKPTTGTIEDGGTASQATLAGTAPAEYYGYTITTVSGLRAITHADIAVGIAVRIMKPGTVGQPQVYEPGPGAPANPLNGMNELWGVSSVAGSPLQVDHQVFDPTTNAWVEAPTTARAVQVGRSTAMVINANETDGVLDFRLFGRVHTGRQGNANDADPNTNLAPSREKEPVIGIGSATTGGGTGGGTTGGATGSQPFDPKGCTGAAFKVDKFYDDEAVNGAVPNDFDTGGMPICLTEVATYHWNNGQGTPSAGQIFLLDPTAGKTIGPFQAHTTPATNNVPANWEAPLTTPVLLDGRYEVVDSDPKTWSSSQSSGGKGFIRIFGVGYVAPPAGGGTTGGGTTGGGTTGGGTTGGTGGTTPTPTSSTSDLSIIGLIALLIVVLVVLGAFFIRRRSGSTVAGVPAGSTPAFDPGETPPDGVPITDDDANIPGGLVDGYLAPDEDIRDADNDCQELLAALASARQACDEAKAAAAAAAAKASAAAADAVTAKHAYDDAQTARERAEQALTDAQTPPGPGSGSMSDGTTTLTSHDLALQRQAIADARAAANAAKATATSDDAKGQIDRDFANEAERLSDPANIDELRAKDDATRGDRITAAQAALDDAERAEGAAAGASSVADDLAKTAATESEDAQKVADGFCADAADLEKKARDAGCLGTPGQDETGGDVPADDGTPGAPATPPDAGTSPDPNVPVTPPPPDIPKTQGCGCDCSAVLVGPLDIKICACDKVTYRVVGGQQGNIQAINENGDVVWSRIVRCKITTECVRASEVERSVDWSCSLSGDVLTISATARVSFKCDGSDSDQWATCTAQPITVKLLPAPCIVEVVTLDLRWKELIGHVGIRLICGSEDELWGYFPKDRASLTAPFKGTPGSVDRRSSSFEGRDTIGSDYSDYYCKNGKKVWALNLSCEQCRKIRQYWEQLSANPGTYILASSNCATHAIDSLRAAGIPLNKPNGEPEFDDGYTWATDAYRPGLVDDLMDQLAAEGGISERREIDPNPNCGTEH